MVPAVLMSLSRQENACFAEAQAGIRLAQEFRVSYAEAGESTIVRVTQNAARAKEAVNQVTDCHARGAGESDLIS